MADKKISELDVAEAVNGGELLLAARDVEGTWSNEAVPAATLAAYVLADLVAGASEGQVLVAASENDLGVAWVTPPEPPAPLAADSVQNILANEVF